MDESVKQENSPKKSKWKIVGVLTSVFIIAAIGAFGYMSHYYPAEDQVREVIGKSLDVQVTTYENLLVFSSNAASAREGIVFYPETKVDYMAYAPMMNMMASQGFLCVLVDMPFTRPNFDKDAAKLAIDKFEFVSDWYIGGHGKGGQVAAEYAKDHADLFKGVILAGAYADVDLSDSGLGVISLYGSNDNIMGMEQYNHKKSNLPEDVVEVAMEGGNHSYFGYYGDQKKDGLATITKYQQQAYSAINILSFITGEEVTTTLEDLKGYGQ